ncbi:hypothetical protein FA09DRAFT_344943 [Tilletiopsis washingtonensis]|uniref:Uncharacterized protein n=1 Tax=Tilletiopsis washingtonensis TaxID=58919 RepID=A0A316ZIN4_9BASI|nr:hypothetical protein FA09DRAFT_344943 [Tilletiopsis washingtonensis]PWO00885.1 hypothetical protein FA09DRAFT_344943 [Tilletiopsis washingtonensis]
MDHPVSYQPAPRTASTSAAARISSFFQSPLRKSASKGDLSSASRFRSAARPGSSGSGSAPTSASAFAASIGASRSFHTAGHGPSSSGGSQNPSYRVPPPREPHDYADFYVPYHGPISPRPGGGAAQFEVLELDQGSPRRGPALPPKDDRPAGRLGGPYGKSARHSRTSSAGTPQKGALRSDGFGVEGLGIGNAPSLPPGAAGRTSELQRGDLGRSDDANERLERFFQHGAASGDRTGSPTDRFRPALGFGLPTAYVHGGNTPRLCDSPPTRMGHISGLPSLMRADYQETELRRRDGTAMQSSSSQPHLQQPFSYRGAAAVPRAHGNAPPTSVPSSDQDDSPTLPSDRFTPERRTVGLAPSISSNEGGSAGWTSAFEGGNRSAATSMTSLRAPSMAAHGSLQGQPKRLLSQSSGDALASGPASRPRARTASSSDVRARAAQVIGPHEAPARVAPPAVAGRGQPTAPAAQVTPPTMWQQGAPLLSPIAASTLGESSSPGPSSQHQRPSSRPEEVVAASELRDLVLTAEARKKYRLLQQLHLDEANAHAPEHGWYDANSGCERVLMPRPKLKNRTSIDGSSDTHSRRSTYASVERNRPRPRDSDPKTQHLRRKTESNPDIAAQALAQERLAHNAASVPTRRRAHTDASPPLVQAPFFHHRAAPLPPPAFPPQDDRACSPMRSCHPRASGTIEVDGAHVWPRKTPTPTSAGMLVNPLEASPDLETVIAQGIALDRDREQWRREYARSIGGHEHRRSRSQDRRSSSSSTRPRNRRFHWDQSEPLPADAGSVAQRGTLELPRSSTAQPPRQRTLRYVRSSPQLGEKERERFEPRAPSPPSPVPTSFQALSPFRGGRKRAQSMGDDGRNKQRDSGWSGVFRKRRSRAPTPSSPVLGSPRTDRDHSRVVSASLATQRRMRNSASWDKAVVAAEQPLHIHASRRQSWRPSSSVGGRSTPAQDRADRTVRAQLVFDEPVIIGRQPGFDGRAEEPSSTGLTRSASDSSGVFRFPSSGPAPSTPGTSYGVAFSSPRPDISDNPTPLMAPLRTGAHPTSPTYHRPKNSADLRTLLAEAGAQRASTEPAHSRSGSGNVKRASHEQHEEVRRLSQSSPPLAPKRTSSLGRRAAAAMAAEVRVRKASQSTPASAGPSGETPKLAPALFLPPQSPTLPVDTTIADSPFPNQSLPVPPRKVKSSSSSMDSRTPEPASMPTFESGTFGTPYVDAGAAAATSYAAAPISTPTLGTSASRQANASYFAEARGTPPQVVRSPLAGTQRTPRQNTSPHSRWSPSSAQRSPRSRGLDPNVAARRHRAGLSASSSDSSHSNRSHLPHELWTADDDPDAFSQLFLRRQPEHEAMLGVVVPRERAVSASSQGAESGHCDVSPTRPRADSERSKADSELQEGIATPQQALLRTPRLGDRSVSPRSPFYSSGDEAQETTFMAQMTPGERYRAALGVRRDSDTVSTLVQHYLSPEARARLSPSTTPFADNSKLSSPARLGRVSAELPPARRVLQTQRSLNALDAHKSPSPELLTPSATIDFDDYVAPRSSSDQLASARRSSFLAPPSPRRGSVGEDDGRVSMDSMGSYGVSPFVRPQVWPDPPRSPGGARVFP